MVALEGKGGKEEEKGMEDWVAEAAAGVIEVGAWG